MLFKKTLVGLLIFLFCAAEMLAQNSTFLTINPQGHKAELRAITITNDKKYLLSAGDDKVVRVWELATGQVVDELYGEVGDGFNGSINFIALSPNNKLLAVTANFFDDTYKTGIRIYDFTTKKQLSYFSCHNDNITELKFLEDGKRIVSCSMDGSVKLWDITSGTLIREFKAHTKSVYSIDVYKNNLVSAGWDNKVILWDINKDTPKKITSIHTAKCERVAYSPDGARIISVSWDTMLVLYDANLNVLHKVKNATMPYTALFSPMGDKIVFGCDFPNVCTVYKIQNDKLVLYNSYYDHHQTVIATAFIDNETIATGGGEDNEIDIWKTSDTGPKRLKRFIGKGRSVYNASLSGSVLAYGNTKSFDSYSPKGKIPMENTFDLFSHVSGKTLRQDTFPEKITENNRYRLYTKKGETYETETLIIENKADPSQKINITRDPSTGFLHHSYTFDRTGKWILSAGDGVLTAYNTDGEAKASFIGQAAQIWSAVVTKDNRFLLSGSRDQTICIYDLTQLESVPSPYSLLQGWREYMDQLGISDVCKINSLDAWQKFIDAAKKDNQYDMAPIERYFNSNIKYKYISPVATLFFSNDQEWVIWCPDGYFTSSKNGAKYVGYHMNKGLKKESKYYPFEQFDLKFNRPDIIMKRLALGDSSVYTPYYLAYQKRLKKMNIKEEDLGSEIHLPQLQLKKSERITTEVNSIVLNIHATDDKYKLKRLFVYVNDVPIYGSKGLSLENEQTSTLEKSIQVLLNGGKNRIQVSVLNEKGAESLKETLVINEPKSTTKRNLYLVSIGISSYKNPKMNLTYASKDARNLSQMMLAQKSRYANVFVDTLINENATVENILKIKQKLHTSKIDDVVVVFFAGHGILDHEMNYFLATYDINFANPSQNGLSYDQLESLMDSIPARNKVIFMDACHSGEVDKDEMELMVKNTTEHGDIVFRSVNNTGVQLKSGTGFHNSFELMKELFADIRKGNGATVISSAGGAEYAMEGDQWKNGVFTYCLLNGLQNKLADSNKDGSISVTELKSYLQKSVFDMTKGKQKPTSRIENIYNDWEF